MRAVVSAGGTSEPVDDVRVLTNRSTGRFGAAIAAALARAGVETTLLASRAMTLRRDVELHPALRVLPYESYGDLARLLEREARARPDLLFMAAAVSDYSPAPLSGKLSSGDEERSLLLRRNPKLLSELRGWCGPAATLVGFKLLSGVSHAELIEVAQRQRAGAQLDLTVANDLARLGGRDHPVSLVSADAVQELSGPRRAVARQLVAAALARRPRDEQGGAPDSASARFAPLPLALAAGSGRVTWLCGPGLALAPTAQVDGPEPGAWAASLAEAWARQPRPRESFALDLGERVGWAPRDLRRARADWEQTSARLRERLLELGLNPEPRRSGPVLVGPRLAGAIAWTEAGVALVDAPSELPLAWRDEALAALAEEDLVASPAEEAALAEHGFLASERDPRRILCPAPARHPRLARGASLCLLAPSARSVLLGRRKAEPYRDAWAFPGGSLEPAESAWEAARRELQEETGLGLPAATAPLAEERVFVGSPPQGSGEPWVVELRCFVAATLYALPPAESGELAARWVPYERALGLDPLTAGTRRVLRAWLPSARLT